MRTWILVALLALSGWMAWPAAAGDDEKAGIEALQAELQRSTAELAHIREAYDQAAAQLERSTKSVAALSSSLTQMRQLNALLQQELAELRADVKGRPEDDPARLKQELREEQTAHASDITKLREQLAQLAERCNRVQVEKTVVEARLAEVQAELEAERAKK